MPKRKDPELTPDEQFKRFVKTAKEHEIDEHEEALDGAFKKIVSPGKTEAPSHKEKNSKGQCS